MVDTLAAVARKLYGLDPAEFTAARNSRARELKPAHAVLAAQVAALRKPSPAAWAVNLIARQRTGELAALLLVGEQMRTAQQNLDRAELGRLGSERRVAVAALTREGGNIAAGLGHPLTPGVLGEVEQTLQAGTSDPAAAAAVASGLLVRALRAVGFESVDLDGAVAVPDAVSRWVAPLTTDSEDAPSPVQLAEVRRRKEARQEADRRERDADIADAETEALDRRAQRSQLRRGSLEAEIAELQEQLATAESALRTVAADESALAEARVNARSIAEQARLRARKARAAADALEDR